MKLEHVSCNVCGKDDTEVLFSRTDTLTQDPTNFSVVRCRDCRLVYVNPRPRREDIGAFYTPEFVSYQFDVDLPERPSFRERLVSMVAKSSATQRVAKIRKLIKPDQQFRALDIGCGKGSFLDALRQAFECDVAGIDFDADAVTYCRERLGLNVVSGDVSKLDEAGSDFDLVTMWHFLEHEYDPADALKTINGCLQDGQYLVVEVPNVESLENQIFKDRSFLYDVPRHLYDFSPQTISALLKRAGFEVDSISYPHFAGGWLGSVQENFFAGKIYRDLRSNIFLFILISQILFPLDYASALMKRGSIMTIVARKRREAI